MTRMFRSICAVLALVVAGLTLSVAVPAWACGCGAYIPDQAGATIADERALVTWDGTTENIVVGFNVSGSSKTAAWVMPVPSAAEVSLADQEVFEELERITAPRIEYRDSWWPTFTWLFDEGDGVAGAPRDSAVDVLSQQRIGPFDVTRLAADDPAALATWLSDNGFPHPSDLDANLAPYVEDSWEIVAIKLAPASDDAALTGDLQPLRLSFATRTMIYPMRLSKSADNTQDVELYLLADHRMDPESVPTKRERPYLGYAGRIEPSDADQALRGFVGDGAFLTRWNNYIGQPRWIDGDYIFAQAAEDTPYQRVNSIERNRGDITGLILLGVVVVAVLVVVLVIVLRRRRPSGPSTPDPA